MGAGAAALLLAAVPALSGHAAAMEGKSALAILIDTLHVAVAPVELGSGVRLWESPEELLDRFHCDVVPSPSGVTHHLFWRR